MKPEKLRALVAAMDKRPWYSAESRWQSDCVLTGAPDVHIAGDGGRVLAQANPNFPYRANLDGIVALANHGDALVELWLATIALKGAWSEDAVAAAKCRVDDALATLERLP